MPGVKPFDASSNQRCVQASRVDDRVGSQLRPVRCYDFDSFLPAYHMVYRSIEHRHTTSIFNITLQRQHQRVAVDNAGAGAVHGCDAFEVRFHRQCLLAA